MTLYDRIAAFYDPWSRSVTEDVSFYVDEALASVDGSLELHAERVQRQTRLAIANLAERQLQLALSAEVLDTDVLDLVHRGGRLGSCERGVLECLGVHGSARLPMALGLLESSS